MSGEDALEDDDFDLDDDIEEQGVKKVVHAADPDIRRRLEDQLEERRLRKSIQDYDFDLD